MDLSTNFGKEIPSRNPRENRSGKGVLGTLWRLILGVSKRLKSLLAHAQDKYQGGLIDLPTCHHTEVKFKCGF